MENMGSQKEHNVGEGVSKVDEILLVCETKTSVTKDWKSVWNHKTGCEFNSTKHWLEQNQGISHLFKVSGSKY